ncbi:dienelactone hydrolase family protein [Paraflavitalea sp. CAU 1676]|uniref:alpha/beta hydrolase n=1 Tax=Paraflavitalea sp. CAU 1676 TaxID=3032598 RepID=UPI0023DB8415|nr:dienelactone hydrolase family protein [Paraflavitalea sp. CAU 1676]MDF2189075.1 dienelactone hydrolase family protein [Paraflavitalea sp. CAU 1676]
MRQLLLLVSLMAAAFAGYTQAVMQDSVAGFRYVEQVRGGVRDNGAYPLLIAFHYSSGTPQESLADYELLKTPVRIIVPVGNVRKRNGYSYYPHDHYKLDSLAQMKEAHITLDSIAAFVKAIEAKYGVKPVVSGISQGGDLAWMLAVYYPPLVKAAFPFAAFIHRQAYASILDMPANKVPVYLYQGEDDPIIAVSYTREAVKALGRHMPLKLSTYPGLKHDISPQMKTEYSGLMDKVLR